MSRIRRGKTEKRWRLIEMRDVGFGYHGGAELLSGMTLSLQPGMFHFLTGPSG
jgi:cell division transport system ATP-binding protein